MTTPLTIDHDLLCLRCNYNLRTLPITARCPECNLEVTTTLRAPRLPEKLLTWFPRGCRVLAATLLLFSALQLASNSSTVAWFEQQVLSWHSLEGVMILYCTNAFFPLAMCVGWLLLLLGSLQTPLTGMPRHLPRILLGTVILQSLLAVSIAVINGYYGYRAMTTYSYITPPFYTWFSSIAGYAHIALRCLLVVTQLWYLSLTLRALGRRALTWAFLLVISLATLLELAFFIFSIAYGSGVLRINDSTLLLLWRANTYTSIALLFAQGTLWIITALRFNTRTRTHVVPIIN